MVMMFLTYFQLAFLHGPDMKFTCNEISNRNKTSLCLHVVFHIGLCERHIPHNVLHMRNKLLNMRNHFIFQVNSVYLK